MGTLPPGRHNKKCCSLPRSTSRSKNEDDLKKHLIRIRSVKNNPVFIADTRFLKSFANKNSYHTAISGQNVKQIQQGDNNEANRRVCCNRYRKPPFRRVITHIEFGCWTVITASVIVVEDKRANILGRNLLTLIGIHLNQQKPPGKSMNFISDDNKWETVITYWVESTYSGLCLRIGRSKNRMEHKKT